MTKDTEALQRRSAEPSDGEIYSLASFGGDANAKARFVAGLIEKVEQAPATPASDVVAGGEALREALRRAALRLEICAGYIDSSFGLSGTRRAERAMKAKHFALEALAALKGPAA